jgi:hypothetical protein
MRRRSETRRGRRREICEEEYRDDEAEEEEYRDEEEEEEYRDEEEEEEYRDDEEEEEKEEDRDEEKGGTTRRMGEMTNRRGDDTATPLHRTARRVLRANDNNRAEPGGSARFFFFLNYLLCTYAQLQGRASPLPWKYISTIIYNFFHGKPSPASPAPKPNPKWEHLLN